MRISKIDGYNIDAVAEFMSSIKPEWWDYEGAYGQLQDISLLARLVGWCMEEEGRVCGWILCAEFEGYSYLSIENLGYDQGGRYVMEQQTEPLLRQAETYAKEKGYRNMKYIIGSTDMSCHGRPLVDYAEELKNLRSKGREHFDYFVEYGFRPTGFIPDCYGKNYHGSVMIKSLI